MKTVPALILFFGLVSFLSGIRLWAAFLIARRKEPRFSQHK